MPFWGHEDVPKIDADAAADAVGKGALLVDLGEPTQWFNGHIPGARLVEVQLVEELMSEPKDRPIIIAGRDPELAEETVGALREHGYDAAMLAGGPGAWAASGRTLVRADGKTAR